MRRLSVLFALTAFAVMGAAPPSRLEAPRVDASGDPLPAGALARLGTARFRCEGGPRSVLSPDGKLIVVGGREGIHLLDASTGKLVRRLRPDSILSFTGQARFSPDGKLLAAWESYETQVFLLDVASGGVVRRLESPARDARVSFSAKGGLVAVGGQDHSNKVSVLLYDKAGKKLKTFDTDLWSACPLLSPDGKALATWSWGGRDGSVQLWDVAKGEKTHKLSLDDRCVGAAFSPDGKRLAVLAGGSSLVLFDAQDGKELAHAAPRRRTEMVAYSPDGKALATGSETGVQLWDPGDCRRVAQCDSPSGTRFASLAFPAGNRVLALGECGRALRLWDVPSGRVLSPTGGHVRTVDSLAFSRDGRTLLTAGSFEDVRHWATADWKEVRRFALAADERDGRPSYLISPDGRYVLGSESKRGSPVVEVASGQEVAEVSGYNRYANSYVSAGAFSAEGRFWVAVETPRSEKSRAVVRVWNLDTGRRRAVQFDAPPKGSPLIAASPGAKVIAVVSRQDRREDRASLGLYDLADGKLIFGKQLGAARFLSAVFSPDGGTIVICGRELLALDAITGEATHRLEGAKDRYCKEAAFSPDGRVLAVSYLGWDDKRGEVLLWELASGKVRTRFEGHRALSLAFSPDGKRLATGGEDTTVLLWDASGRSRQPKGELKPAEAAALWADLDSDDAAKAHDAMARLEASPAAALSLFRKELKPAEGKPLSKKELDALIADLGDDSFEVREKATAALKKLGRTARPALFAAMKTEKDLETRRRLNDLLEATTSASDRKMLRPTRALEVLERLGTPEARRLLAALAKGNPDARLTSDAAAALKRLEAR